MLFKDCETLYTYRINKVTVESITELLNTGGNFIKHHSLLASICKRRQYEGNQTNVILSTQS